MSVDKFKFVSPGVQVAEIDNSQFNEIPDAVGPVVVGRSERGPALRPVKVSSFSEFVEIFGNPIPGGRSGDIWRDGNYTAPTYGAYAAQAYLANRSPLTFVRLLGAAHANAVTDSGEAGWRTGTNTPNEALASNGGAFGLFIGHKDQGVDVTGSMALAAVFYLTEGGVKLGGPQHDDPTGDTVYNAATFVRSDAADSGFTAVITDSTEASIFTASFNFNPASEKFIRKVFNTNPTLTNSTITQAGQADYGLDQGTSPNNNVKTYWLGETFEQFLASEITGSSAAGDRVGVVLALDSQTSAWNGHDYRKSTTPPQTGWIIGQDLSSDYANYNPESMQNLFKFHGLEVGEWDQQNLKISISEVDYSKNDQIPYGTFTVEIRKANDNDTAKVVVERFDNCNLNPASSNYIAKKIGDMYRVWDEAERAYVSYGNYLNNSKYIRVEVNPDVENGVVASELLPFGFRGPAVFSDYTYSSASATLAGSWLKGSGSLPYQLDNNIFSSSIEGYKAFGADSFAATFKYPRPKLRFSSSAGNVPVAKQAYWGIDVGRYGSPVRFDESYKDMVRTTPVGVDPWTPSVTTQTSASFVFSLDDVCYVSGSTTNAYYASGSRVGGESITAARVFGTGSTATKAVNYQNVLDAEFNRFTMPLHGGFDGLNIKEREPFRNSQWDGSTDTTSYSYNSIKRAIDSVSDAEETEINILTVPGITETTLTDHVMDVSARRADALGIIDVEGGFIPSTENNKGDSHPDNRGSYSTVVTNMRSRSINNSYGCAYYPWVQIRDTINGSLLWVPPSIVALGAMAFSEATSQLWFAPAGFTRGGLSQGAAGIPVINVREKLKQTHRDKLYEVNVNPIAHFPAQGIVILGQRTLQATQSKLSSVNIRRLVIFIKRTLSRIAATTLFDQNIDETWQRFYGPATTFLDSVKAGLGLESYRLVLDESTTTPELQDRNIVYAKVAIKPIGAIEFFAIDLAIERSGASFTD